MWGTSPHQRRDHGNLDRPAESLVVDAKAFLLLKTFSRFVEECVSVVSTNKLRLARRKRGVETPRDDTPGISPTDIATHNSRAALEILRRAGPQTRLELSAHLQLTEPAIAGIMTRLLEAGHVMQRKRAGTGRYVSTEYLLIPQSAYAVGLRWSAATGGKAALVDLAGSVVATEGFLSLGEAGRAVEALLQIDGRAKRCRGLAVALSPDLPAAAVEALSLPEGLAVRLIEETEAAVIAERMLGVGQRDGGIVVILVGKAVRAGLLIGGKPFKGEHGRAGNIGAMRTGHDRVPLDEVLGMSAQPAFIRPGENSDPATLGRWADMAADHLKDAVIAVGGFLSPGLILIGGDLSEEALEAMIGRVNRLTREFIASFSVPELVRTHFSDGGTAEGAAVGVFLGDLLPEVATMDARED